MKRLIALALLVWAWAPGQAWAQERSAIVLRTDTSLAAIATSIAAGLERRTARPVSVGEVSSEREIAPGTIGVVREGDRIQLLGTAPSGRRHVTDVGAAETDRATTRVIVVALASFLESLEADVEPPIDAVSQAPVLERFELPIDGSALEDLAPPRRPPDVTPGLVVELRGRAAYATQRDVAHAAWGMSFGVCFGTWWCLQLDADAMAPEEDHALPSGILSYQSTTIGIGGRFLPLRAGPVRGGVGIDALARVGHLWTDLPQASDTTPSGGMRLMADIAIQLGGPVFLAVEGGADIAFNAVRYQRGASFVFTEDVVTLWAALALRIGPE